MAFLTAEDQALHEALQGVLVQDVASTVAGEPREATVRFRLPEATAKEEHYPFITIDLLNAERSTRREHRGNTRIQYLPDEPEYEGADIETLAPVSWPIPYDLVYMVVTYARNWQHDRAMFRGLLRGPFRERSMHLVVGGPGPDTIHSDDATIRYMEMVSRATANTTDQHGKRLFRQIYTIRVETELPPEIVDQIAAKVQQVVITLVPSTVNAPAPA